MQLTNLLLAIQTKQFILTLAATKKFHTITQ